MTLRVKILIRIGFLTFLIILAMSITYYYLFTRNLHERSQQNVKLAFNLIFDDLQNRVHNVQSKVEEFIQESLLSPMYLTQVLQSQYRSSGTEWTFSSIRKMITHLTKMSFSTRKFGVLVDAEEVLIYGKHKHLLVAYAQAREEELTGVYLLKGDSGVFVLSQLADEWYGSLKDVNTLPQYVLPDHISPVYQEQIPRMVTVEFINKQPTVTIKIVVPIFQKEQIEGVCIIHLAIRQEDVERYTRLSQMLVNVFAGTSLSVGTLADYNSIVLKPKQQYQLNLLELPETLPLEFSLVTIQESPYYQGMLALGDENDPVGAILGLFPRQIEEEQKRGFFIVVAGITLLFSILAVVEAFGLSAAIVHPIKQMTQVIWQVAQGDLSEASLDANRKTDKFWQRFSLRFGQLSKERRQSKDELIILAQAFQAMVEYLRDIANTANQISRGEISQTLTPRSDHDVLGNAFYRMTTYLHEMAALSTAIAEGDLKKQISLCSENDTFGLTMRTMTQGLRSLIKQIRISAEQIAVTGTTIAELTDKDIKIVQSAQKSVEEMVSTMTDMGNSVETVTQNMEILLTSVEGTFHCASKVTESITNIASNTSELALQSKKTISTINDSIRMLEDVTEKTEVSKQLLQETIQNAQEGQEAVEEVRASMDAIQQTNLDTVETISRFEKRSADIGTILDVIRDITEQSSLLALNASIIAAQAGSHGRGFSVIAEEMRNLANEVNTSTKNIADIIRTVQQETGLIVQKIHEGKTRIEQGVVRTQQAQERLQNIITSVARSSAVGAEIADALHGQRTTNREIMSELDQVGTMTSEITKATNDQKTSAIQINHAVKHILELASNTQEVATQQLRDVQQVLNIIADSVSRLTEQNLESSQHINRMTTADLAAQAQILLELVDRFQIEA